MASKKQGFYKRGNVWWLRTDPVTKKPVSTGCRSFDAAELWRGERERVAANPTLARSLSATFDEWAERYIEMKDRDSSAATVEYCTGKLGPALRLWGEGCKLAAIDAGKLDAYVASRREERVTDHTISKEVAVIVQVLKLAKRGQAYGGDLETLRPPDLHADYVPRARSLSPDEVRRLRGAVSARCSALIAVCVALGCRRSEAVRLEPSDVDLAAGVVHIRGTKTEGSDRRVPILSLFRPLLEEALPLLPVGEGFAHSLSVVLPRACAKLGIPRVSPNDLRRTHATWLLEAGVDRDVIRRLLGHTTPRLVDQVYGRPAPRALGALAEERLAKTVQSTTAPSGNTEERHCVSGSAVQSSCFATEPKCEKAAATERIATGRRRWRRVATGTIPLQGYWAGRKGRVAA
jgi:integrase